jgi:hypothetical protein
VGKCRFYREIVHQPKKGGEYKFCTKHYWMLLITVVLVTTPVSVLRIAIIPSHSLLIFLGITANYYIPFQFCFSLQLFSISTAKNYWESIGMKLILEI